MLIFRPTKLHDEEKDMSKNISKEIYYTICPVGNASYLAANNGFLKDGLKKIGYTPIKLQMLEPEKWKTHF